MEFNAIKYTNKNSPFQWKKDHLPVEVKDGVYKLPSPHDILVKVHYAALNPVDMILKNTQSAVFFWGEKGFASDYAGEIVALGAAAAQAGFGVGDRIAGLYQNMFGLGTAAEYILINTTKPSGVNARKIPGSLSYAEAASYPLVFGTAQTMWDSVKQGNSFRKVLILGAGTAVGRYNVQLAKNAYLAEEIVVTCSSRTEATIRELGASEVIDYTKHLSILGPVLESVKRSGPFDVVLDCCGNSDLFPAIEHVLQPRANFGSYVTIVGDKKLNFSSSTMLSSIWDNVAVGWRQLSNYFGWLPYFYTLAFIKPTGLWPDKCVKNLEEKNVRVFIDSEYPPTAIQDAVDKLISNKAEGKILIKIA